MPSAESRALGLSRKAAVVTGATQGIGRATARLLADLGVDLVAVGRTWKDDTLPAKSAGRIVRFKADVSDEARARDCLLYTSPSPRDLSTSRMPSSA